MYVDASPFQHAQQHSSSLLCTVCNNAWNRDSLDEILFLIFEISAYIPCHPPPHLLPIRSCTIAFHASSVIAIFFTVIAFAYYHQVLDPTSAANVSRAPANFASGAPGPYPYPDHYNRPYDTEAGAYNSNPYAPYPSYEQPQPQYAPPPGPPPSHTEMGYGVGMGAKERSVKEDNESDMTKFEDPFADFDGPSKPKTPPVH